LRRKSCRFILFDQGDSLQQGSRQVSAQPYLGPQGVFLRSTHEVESVLGLRSFLAEPVSNRFEQSFCHAKILLSCSGQAKAQLQAHMLHPT
jgi:hypothetical protein